MFETLVAHKGLDALIDDDMEVEKSSKRLTDRVASFFRDSGLLFSRARSNVAAPIYRDRDLIGRTRPHRFAFVQMNGSKRPMEVFDFEHGNDTLLRYHAGWAKTAFTDIQADDVDPFALIVHPESMRKREVFEYSMDLLKPVCNVVNLADAQEEFIFMTNCRKAAGLCSS